MWRQSVEVRGDRVYFELRFRTLAELTTSLTGAGFSVEHVFGDRDRRPVAAGNRELILVTTRG